MGERARFGMQVRWSDVDLFGHVNNAAFLRFLDDARFATFPAMGVDENGALTASKLVVVKHEIEYRGSLAFRPAPVVVEVWVPTIGRTSVDFGYEILDGERSVLLARSRMVQLDSHSATPRPFTDGERAAFQRYADEPPQLRGW